ncbi:helix-turn-helix domain-containing protein [Methylobacterium sp. CM6257]
MSFRITLTPSKRTAGRFIEKVRRALLTALAQEEAANGLTQSDIARSIGVNRSVIHRELRGHKDITLGRVAELAWAMKRKPQILLIPEEAPTGNISRELQTITNDSSSSHGQYKIEQAFL